VCVIRAEDFLAKIEGIGFHGAHIKLYLPFIQLQTALILLGERKAGRPSVSNQKVFADFHNADTRGRLRLNCIGTIEDLARQQIVLRDGVCLTLYSEELEVEGVVEYSTDEHLWVAVIDWHAIKDGS
jgi:hypothetical protein